MSITNLLKAKSEFRKKGVTLVADKSKQGGGGSWNFAGEDNLIKTIQGPLSECGLEFVASMKYLNDLGVNTVEATLYHIESGESISSTISLGEVEPRKDKNNNAMYLDAEIERGKQFGYWSRTLAIRLLGLSDIDPEDMNNRPSDISDDAKEMLVELYRFIDKSSDKDKTLEWIKKTYGTDNVNALKSEQVKTVVSALRKKSQDANT